MNNEIYYCYNCGRYYTLLYNTYYGEYEEEFINEGEYYGEEDLWDYQSRDCLCDYCKYITEED